jgi:hypothetical protein
MQTWQAEQHAEQAIKTLGSLIARFEYIPESEVPPELQTLRKDLEDLETFLCKTDFSAKAAWKHISARGGKKASPSQLKQREEWLKHRKSFPKKIAKGFDEYPSKYQQKPTSSDSQEKP